MGSYMPTKEELDRLKMAFKSIKAENDLELKQHFDDLFVTTNEYFQTQIDGKAIVLGRKGSGKSALLYGFACFNGKNYQGLGDINADEIPITSLYNYYLRDILKRTAEIQNIAAPIPPAGDMTDIASFLDPVRLSTFAWQKACQTLGLYLAAIPLIKSPKCTKAERQLLTRVTKSIKGSLDDSNPSAFLYSLLTENYDEVRELIEETISGFIGNAWGKLISLLINRILTLFGSKPPKDYHAALQIVQRHFQSDGWRVLVTFDRFDDFYDKHFQALQKEESQEESNKVRRQILSAVLEGLILSVSAIKNSADYKWLDLLVTVPMDKFMELSLRERARIEIENTIPLHWTPLELFDYANRRIASALGEKIPEGKAPWYFIFPDSITNIATKGTREDSFLYVLRHTLWKPRELQMYVQRLLERLFSGGFTDEQREIVFRQAIQEQSQEIIRLEFNPEFRQQYPRIWTLLRQLKASTIYTVMSLSDLMSALKTGGLSSEITEKTEVLRRLYLMGVVGVRRIASSKQMNNEPTVTQNRSEVSYTYFFNSKDHDPFSSNADVCFHPMFFDEIGAMHREDYIVNELRWDMFATDGKNLRYKPR